MPPERSPPKEQGQAGCSKVGLPGVGTTVQRVLHTVAPRCPPGFGQLRSPCPWRKEATLSHVGELLVLDSLTIHAQGQCMPPKAVRIIMFGVWGTHWYDLNATNPVALPLLASSQKLGCIVCNMPPVTKCFICNHTVLCQQHQAGGCSATTRNQQPRPPSLPPMPPPTGL